MFRRKKQRRKWSAMEADQDRAQKAISARRERQGKGTPTPAGILQHCVVAWHPYTLAQVVHSLWPVSDDILHMISLCNNLNNTSLKDWRLHEAGHLAAHQRNHSTTDHSEVSLSKITVQ